MATTFESSYSSQKVVKVSPISDLIKQLQVISCDFCDAKASFDAHLEGIISGVNVLKRYCEDCVKASTTTTTNNNNTTNRARGDLFFPAAVTPCCDLFCDVEM